MSNLIYTINLLKFLISQSIIIESSISRFTANIVSSSANQKCTVLYFEIQLFAIPLIDHLILMPSCHFQLYYTCNSPPVKLS